MRAPRRQRVHRTDNAQFPWKAVSRRTTTPPRTAPSGPLLGTSVPRQSGETYAQAVARANATYGGLDVIRLFHAGLPVSWAKMTADVGTTPLVVSFKMSPVEVVAGRYDSYMRSWFASAPTGRPTWWTYYHEPEDNIEAGQFTAAQYRAAWAHLDALADEASNPSLRATLILMCWTLDPASHRNWTDYYSAGAIDAQGWDCYSSTWSSGSYRSATSMLANVKAIATQTGLPWGLAEFGSLLATGDDGSGRAAWLSDMVAEATAGGASFLTYFDSTVGGEFRLLDEPSRSRWRQLVSG